MIRYANKYDIQDIIRLLKKFAENSSMAKSYDPLMWSKTHIEVVLANIFAGAGFILINENKTAILVAIKMPVLWVANAFQLQEVMLHSDNKITTCRLIKEYVRIAKKLIDDGQVQQAIMCSQNEIDFGKIGLKKIETHWEI